MSYERENIRRLDPYVPGEQPEGTDVVKLNTNENPYPPAPQVLDAIRSVSPDALRRYPSPSAPRFRKVAARVHGLSPDQVIATNGGDELLRLAVTVFCDPAGGHGRGGMGQTAPTYSLYNVLAGIQNTPVLRVPLEEDWAVPHGFSNRLNEAGCRLALIVNPHAPSGRLEPMERLERIAQTFDGVLLIDQAYVNFASTDALSLLESGRGLDNVLLLRTLSKGYSLAGLRFGYGLGAPTLIRALDKARDSYNTDVLAQVAAVAALEHCDQARTTWQTVAAERSRLSAALEDRGFRVDPSDANFILTAPPQEGVSACSIFERLQSAGIFVRFFDEDRLRDRLRITVGTPKQSDVLLRALDDIQRSPIPATTRRP